MLIQNGWEVKLIDLLDRNSPILKGKRIEIKKDKYGRGKFPEEIIEKPSIYKKVPRHYRRYGIPLNFFIQSIEKMEKPDAIFVTSSMSYWYRGVWETIKILKKFFPDVPLILGGIYTTFLPFHAKKSDADFIIQGDVFKKLSLLSEILRVKLYQPKIMKPAYELYTALDYLVIITSQGCPFSCTYCGVRRLHPTFQYRKAKEVFEEILYFLAKFKVKDIVFFDDALLCNPELKKLLKLIIDSKINLRLHTPNGLHPHLIDETIGELFYKAGFKSIYLSLESVDEELQKRIKKGISKEDFKRAVSSLYKVGFKEENLHSYIIAGLPQQSAKSIKDSLDFSISLGVKPHLTEYSPIPFTKDFESLGLTLKDDPLLHNNTALPYLFPLGINIDELKRYLKKLVLHKPVY